MGGKGSGGDHGGRRPKLKKDDPKYRMQMSGVRMERRIYEALSSLPGGRTAAVNAAVLDKFGEELSNILDDPSLTGGDSQK